MSSRDNEQDFTQFTGRFDQAAAPSASFAASLRLQLQEGSTMNSLQTAIAPAEAFSVSAKQTSVDGEAPRRRPRRIGFGVLEVAAAILLISTIAFSAFVVRSIGGPADSNNVSKSSSQGSQPIALAATPSPNEERLLSGASGDTGFVPDPSFDSMGFETTTIVDDPRFQVYGMQAVGNLIIQAGTFSEGDYGDSTNSILWATEIGTGEIVWTANGDNISPNFTVGGKLIYAIQTVLQEEKVVATLIAHDLETGERRFGGIQLPVIESGEDLGPIVVGNLVFVADSVGTVIAVDATNGTVIWQTEGDRGSTPPPSRTSAGASGGSLVTDDANVYVVTGANQVRKLDGATGEVIADWYVTSGLDLNLWGVELIVSADGEMFARVNGYPAPGIDDGETLQMMPEAIIAVDTEDGGVDVIGQFPDISGNIAITGDRLIVPARDSANAPIDLISLDRSTGAQEVIPAISTTRVLSVTATGANGEVLILIDSDGLLRIGTISETGEFEIVESQSTRSVPSSADPVPAIVSGRRAFVVNESGRLTALGPVPGQEPGATPE